MITPAGFSRRQPRPPYGQVTTDFFYFAAAEFSLPLSLSVIAMPLRRFSPHAIAA
jgi:hypothetical protein